MLIDTHCHLDQLGSFHDLSELLPRINYPVITMGTHFSQFPLLLDYPALNSNIIPACGFHPWFISDETILQIKPFTQFCLEYNIRVVGEIGLDFSKKYRQTEALQLNVLSAELAFAHQYNLPVSLHVYKAYDALFSLLLQYPVKGVLHSFPGGWQQAQRFIKLGFKIGINALILRPQSVRYIALVQNLPLDSLVVETDAPNINYPDGKIGDLAMLNLIVQQIAAIKNISFKEVSEVTTQNAKEVFKLDEFI